MTSLLQTVRNNNLELGRVQQQLATGDRILRPSDDPAAANSSLSLQRSIEQLDQILENIGHAELQFNLTDSLLSNLTDELLNTQSLASSSLESASTQSQRNAAADQVAEMTQFVLNLANYKDRDVYVFAGTANTEAPFVSEAGGVRYVGQSQSTLALLGAPNPTPVGLTGDEVFGALSSRVQGYRDLSPALTAGTRLSELRGSGLEGVDLGSIRIADGTNTVDVDLTGADRVGDIIDKINDAGAGAITAALGPDRNLTISSTAGGADLTVTEIGQGLAAHHLGIYRSTGQGASFNGDNVHPVLTATTELANLANAAGLDLTSGMTITCGGKSETLNFAADTTVGDLLNRINTANLGVLARINEDGDGIDIVNSLSGAEMTIGEHGGTTADDLGVRSLRGATSLDELNDKTGVRTTDAGTDDIRVTARDGSTFDVDLAGALTLQDVIDRINTAATAAGVGVSASVATVGNGLELSDSTGGAGDLGVTALNASRAAHDLGIETSVSAATLTGDDVNGVAPEGVFAHLAQLENALRSGDSVRITRAAERIKADYDRLVSMRARVGSVVQDMERREARTQDRQIDNKDMLSRLKEVDFTEAVTRFQMLQTALQANLMTGAEILNMSMLDFLR